MYCYKDTTSLGGACEKVYSMNSFIFIVSTKSLLPVARIVSSASRVAGFAAAEGLFFLRYTVCNSEIICRPSGIVGRGRPTYASRARGTDPSASSTRKKTQNPALTHGATNIPLLRSFQTWVSFYEERGRGSGFTQLARDED